MKLMNLFSRYKEFVVLSASLFVTACGGGGSDAPGTTTPTNRAPTADAGADQTVVELDVVTLDGSASADLDGDALTFAWLQTAGPNVALNDATAEQPTFDAPDVTAAVTPMTLTFQLAVSDGSITANDTVDIVVDDVGLGVNTAPTADAGADQTVVELDVVTLDGSASADLDGDALTFAWLQTAGPSVALNDATAEQPTFDAPDVSAPTVLTYQLTVDDGTDSSMDSVDITVTEGLSQVTVAGIVSYEFVPTSHNGNTCFGLNFSGTVAMPIRGATVQLLDAGDNVLAEMPSGDDGAYSFNNITANTDVRIRVRAELKRSGGFPNWDVEVRDNVDLSASPPPLAQRPLYVAQWPLFNTGGNNITDADFVATTGWNSASSIYDAPRAAAPFAVLDNIYLGIQFVLTADAAASFAPLDAFWSANNTKTEGSPTDIDNGELGGSFYRGDIDSLFLVGDALVDTGEFDFYVTLHEWGHYFEDNFSRSDSIGGTHYIGGLVEARVSFGEGWGTGIGAMAAGDPMACNTGAATGAGSWGFNVETYNGGPQGWYNELSVAGLLLDLYDTDDDGVDNNSIGFGPIYDVMVGPQSSTEAFTTLFSFASLLRPNLTAPQQAFLDSLLTTENIETNGLDIWATEQDNINVAVNNERDVLPLYVDFAADGSTQTICTNNDHDPDDDGNKPAEHRYLRINTSATAVYDVTIVPNPVPDPTLDPAPTPPDVINDRSDPDMYIYLNGTLVAFGRSGVDDSESFTTQSLPANLYVADLEEWRYGDPDKSSDFPERVCFDVTMTAQ